MGWWTDTKHAAASVGRTIKRHAGKLARDTAVAGAGIGAGLICAPCGLVAAYAVNEYLGDPIERSTRRAIDKSGAAADDFIGYLEGGEPAPRPKGLATTVEGFAAPGYVAGDAAEDKGVSRETLIALAAGTVTTAAIAFLGYYYLGGRYGSS